MNEADRLKAAYERRLKRLQDDCQHIWSGPLPYSWAPGHYFGHAKCCELCNKVEMIPESQTSGLTFKVPDVI